MLLIKISSTGLLFLLTTIFTQAIQPLYENEDNVQFNFLNIKCFMDRRSVIIYHSNDTMNLLIDFLIISKEYPKQFINIDISPDYEQNDLQGMRFFLVLLRKGHHKKFHDINFTNDDVFLYVECDRHNLSERIEICKSDIVLTRIAALYDPYEQKLHICRYFFNGYTVSVKSFDMSHGVPPVWKMVNNYSDFGGHQFEVGYVISPPNIFR